MGGIGEIFFNCKGDLGLILIGGQGPLAPGGERSDNYLDTYWRGTLAVLALGESWERGSLISIAEQWLRKKAIKDTLKL